MRLRARPQGRARSGEPDGGRWQLANERYAEDDALLVRHHRGSFDTDDDGAAWPEGEDRRMRADFYCWLEDAVYEKEVRGDTVSVPFDPTRHKVQNALEHFEATAHLDAAATPPAWLTNDDASACRAGGRRDVQRSAAPP